MSGICSLKKPSMRVAEEVLLASASLLRAGRCFLAAAATEPPLAFLQNADHLLIGESGFLYGLSFVSGSQNLKHHVARQTTCRS